VTFVVEDFDGGQVSSKIVGAARRGAFQVAQGGTPLSTRTFAWRATNLRVEMINLLVHDTTVPKQFRIVGRGSPVKQNDQTTNLGTAVTDVGDDPAEGNSTAQRRDVNQKRQPQSEGTNPTLGDPRSIIKLDGSPTPLPLPFQDRLTHPPSHLHHRWRQRNHRRPLQSHPPRPTPLL